MVNNKTFQSNKIGTRYFFRKQDDIHFLQDDENILRCHKANEKDFNYRYYECQKGYKPSLEGMQQYKIDINKNIEEMKTDINYLNFENHEKAIYNIFLSKSKNQINKINIEDVSYIEFKYQYMSYNSGLMSIDKELINKKISCFGYDVKNFYAYLLGASNLQIPIKAGKEMNLKFLTFPLSYGYYRVIVEKSDRIPFYKIFSYSTDNVYTHYSINFIEEFYNKKCDAGDKIKITLIIDDEPNAYIYDKENLIKTSKIFDNWYQYINELKTKYPTNKLIKRCSSSLWGYITQYDKTLYTDADEFKHNCNDNISYIFDWNKHTEFKLMESQIDDEKNIFKCEVVNTNNIYKHSLARVKSFLTSYGRIMIAKLLFTENIPISDVVRIQCDGIVLKKPHNFDKTHLKIVEEKKTTGDIIWYSINSNDKNKRTK